MKCRICGSEHNVKNGHKYGRQNYICKNCGFQFSTETGRHTELEERIAITLYCYGFSFRTIAKMLKWNHQPIINWVMNFARQHYCKPVPKGEILVELDEMHHFIGSKKTSVGFGKPMTEQINSLLTGNAGIEIPKLLKRCIVD